MVSKKQISEIETVIGTMTMQELVALREGINERITALQDVEKDRFIAEAKEWAEKAKQLGLDLGNALGIRAAIKRVRADSGSSGGSGDKRASPKVQFSDGKGNTWTGRGIQPKWITIAIAEGRAKTKEDFRIKD